MTDKNPDQAGSTDAHAVDAAPNVAELSAMFNEARNRPCRVDQILINNEDELRTKSHLIYREFSNLASAATLQDVMVGCDTALEAVKQLAAFSGVEAQLEPGNEPSTCNVVLNVAEKGWYGARGGTYFNGRDVEGQLAFNVRNVFGNAESLELESTTDVSQRGQQRRSFMLQFRLPRVRGSPCHLHVAAQNSWDNRMHYSSFENRNRGVTFAASSADGQHEVAYEASWIHLHDPTHRASPAVHAQIGHHLKSALRYGFVIDRRDDSSPLTVGVAAKAVTEVAGIGWDNKLLRYVKQQFELQHSTPLGPKSTFNIDLAAGLLLPWGRGWSNKATPIQERFFLGGMGSTHVVRGFHQAGLGPTDVRKAPIEPSATSSRHGADGSGGTTRIIETDAVGADLSCSVKAAINFIVPVKQLSEIGVRGHVFVNGGSSVQLTGPEGTFYNGSETSMSSAVKTLGNTFRWSVGGGLLFPLAVGQFELNFVQVMSSQRHDRVRSGLEWGFAMQPFKNRFQ